MSDLAMARSFLEHALDHAKHVRQSVTAAWRELDADEKARYPITKAFGEVRSDALVVAIENLIEKIDYAQRRKAEA